MNEKQTEREIGFSISLSFSGALKMTLISSLACILHRRLHTFIYSTASAGGGLRLGHIEVESKPSSALITELESISRDQIEKRKRKLSVFF